MAVTVTRKVATYDATTDTQTVTETSMTGVAVRVRGDSIRYRELNLAETENPTLLFAADTYGDTPAPGDRIEWGGTTYTVRDVNPLAPDGVTIHSRLIVSR